MLDILWIVLVVLSLSFGCGGDGVVEIGLSLVGMDLLEVFTLGGSVCFEGETLLTVSCMVGTDVKSSMS
jgi:hypothetical protein